MKIRIAYAAALVLALTASSAHAVSIRGFPSCGSWVEARTNARGAQPGAAESWVVLNEQMWLLGYLSGLAVGASSDYLRKLDNDSIFVYTDNYCQANPLKSLADAGVALILEASKH
ncbi:hypothetical protein [Burkholderia vietnamiensis]|uniref:hypothetical protein n=1 Tax=Burkholderia vietnamiensis TaxID=60552 RepID=UPI001593986C|nr:hypothetical protein [Burkholderia vietnamiensis]MCA7988918.1 hypothetical protein [Burkholderia vietnamiensis]MCA8194076.1 hypothetical protein [Burkholderia vietnamiensis]